MNLTKALKQKKKLVKQIIQQVEVDKMPEKIVSRKKTNI